MSTTTSIVGVGTCRCLQRVNWVLPIFRKDGGIVEFIKFGKVQALPVRSDIVELGDDAGFSVTVDQVIDQGFTPLVRFQPHRATGQQMDWLRRAGWAEK